MKELKVNTKQADFKIFADNLKSKISRLFDICSSTYNSYCRCS